MPIEISFPRGGRKPPTEKTAKVDKVQYDLFGKKKTKHKNRDLRNEMGLKNPVEKDVCSTEIVKTSANLLSYKTIQEGMIIMGSIREIQKMALTVLLPGRISGRVMITQISTSYTNLLQSIADNSNPGGFCPLKNLLYPGQLVVAKVVKINNEDQKSQISLSLSPHDVNSELNYRNISPGMLLWGAVSDCEEHGYVIDLGIKNCRAFLPKAHVDEGKILHIGEVLWCVVQKYIVDGTVSTATINITQDKIKSNKIIQDVSLNNVQPGMHIDLTIRKILGNGVEGIFLNDFLGYIHESYFYRYFDKPDRYRVGQIVSARILYIEPITKIAYLTLKAFAQVEKPKLMEGLLINGNIFNITEGGLYIRINKIYKGFVPFKRLKTRLSLANDLSYTELIKKYYSTGSQHQCRILSYDFMEQIYICTMEKDMIRQAIFSYNDLKLGQIVWAEIIEIQKSGLLVQIGRVTGFILNSHLTDTILPSYENIKSKYKVGQQLKAKVLNIKQDSSSLLLTIKPKLFTTENNLISYETAQYNQQYPGIIVQITSNGILVSFFGDVKGWIPKNQLSYEKVQHIQRMFKLGQTVNCTIIKSVPKLRKLSLSLLPPKATSNKKSLKLGKIIDAKVTEILTNALQVEVIGSNVGAIIPSQYLTRSPSLAELVLKTYNVDDVLRSLICVNIHGVPILSLDSNLNKDTFKSLTDIKTDMILPCSIHSRNKKRMLLYCLNKNLEKLIVVNAAHICEMEPDPNVLNIEKYQCLYAKVIDIPEKQTIFASTELSECWDGDLTVSKNLLFSYLSDIEKIKKNWTANNKYLTQYKLGQRVTAVVTTIHKDKKVIVSFANDVSGHVRREHSLPDLKVGDAVDGVVLWLNYQRNMLELSLKPNYINHINPIQSCQSNDNKIGKTMKADVMLVKADFILVALRASGNRQLAFLPAKLHPNDLKPNTHLYKIGDSIKVQILQVDNEIGIIGISKQLAKNFEKVQKAIKRARESSQDDEQRVDNKRRKSKNKRKQRNEDSVKAKKQKITHEDTTNEEEEMNEKEMEDNEEIKESDSQETSDQDISNTSEMVMEGNKDIEESDTEEASDKEIINNRNVVNVHVESNEDIEEIDDEYIEKIISKKVSNRKNEAVLSGVNSFWETKKNDKPTEESSDEEEMATEEELKKKQKKKKLTPAERAELAKEEEERLRKIETELADEETAPKTADQFDRLVLVNPNSSLFWISYIAFHLEATEIEKARSVARKALKTIEFREEQEKLNLWISFLNLENRYGSKESFANILEEAVKMNDALTVHLQALNILAESNKTAEFTELLNKVTRKYKQDPNMWSGAAESCYKCDQKEQARSLMQRAVKSLQEKLHVNVIVKFAFMESKWGETERAEAILEKVLASYPKRVDVWCSYVDMLVKGGRIHVARNVLERAVSQKLPPKKMKTIFTKFIQFEKQNGDDESKIEKVRQIASNYVNEAVK